MEHIIAQSKGWKLGVDYPEWGNNELYLQTIQGGYLINDETPKDAYWRVANSAANKLNKPELAKRFFDIIWKGWLCLSTPVLSNMGTNRALPISCFGSFVEDSLYEINRKIMEIAILSKLGGGTSANFSSVRPSGSPISGGGTSDGIIPFLKQLDSTIKASKQLPVRRGACAVYLDIEHKDYLDFLKIRKGQGDPDRQQMRLHQGSVLSDNFMKKLLSKEEDSFERWIETMKWRIERGEPYLTFIDNAIKQAWFSKNSAIPSIKNPQLCVAPETQILTSFGYQTIKDLKDETVDIWNGEQWSEVTVRKTGSNQNLWKVVTNSGYELDCTEYHKWYVLEPSKSGKRTKPPKYVEKRTHELKKGDKLIKFELPVIEGEKTLSYAYDNGFYSGDGCLTIQGQRIYLYGDKRKLVDQFKSVESWYVQHEQNRMYGHTSKLKDKFFVPDATYTIDSRLKWLSGYLDADGTVTSNNGSQSIQVASVEKEFLKEVQLMLQTLGVDSKVVFAREEGRFLLPANDGTGELKEFDCKEASKILINGNSLFKLSQLGLKCNRLKWEIRKPNRECSQFIKINSVQKTDRISDTYCFTEPIKNMGMFNGILTGNCNEIFLPSDKDHTYVCCLSSLNLAKWDEFKDTDTIQLAIWFLDAVIQEFIDKAKNIKGIEDAVRFAEKSRAVGLGVLGWHTYLQSRMIPIESIEARSHNKIIFKRIHEEALRATKELAKEYGEPEWLKGTGRRNLTLEAIAPTRSNSKLSGGVSQGIEPIDANIYTDNDAKGSYVRKNPILRDLLKSKNKDTAEVWNSINAAKGSVQHLGFLSEEEKQVFKTFREINQMELVKQAADRQPYIEQGQSLNLAFAYDAPAKWINQVHIKAWELGLKGLYYYRSQSILNASNDLYQECISCEG